MIEADCVHSTPPLDTSAIPSRRSFLAQTAALAAGSATLGVALPLPETAQGAAAAPDPILTAIEAHKAAREAWTAWVYRHGDLEVEIPHERRKSRVDAFERTIVETDDPRWIEAECEVDRTSDVEEQAACDLLNVRPTTMAGLFALVQHAVLYDTDGDGWPRLDGRSWQTALLENIAVALSMGVSEAV